MNKNTESILAKPVDAMTFVEYKDKLNAMRKVSERAERRLARTYADINFFVEKGSIITDSIGSIKVISSGCYIDNGEPKKAFTGIMITGKGKEYKNGKHRTVYQDNIRNVNST